MYRSPHKPTANGDGRSCLEAELAKIPPNMEVELDKKLAFVMRGSIKQDGDCEDSLARLRKVVHGRTTMVEGDQEMYQFMLNPKSSTSNKYDWILLVPGGWNLMLDASEALMQRCNAAIIECTCRLLRAQLSLVGGYVRGTLMLYHRAIPWSLRWSVPQCPGR